MTAKFQRGQAARMRARQARGGPSGLRVTNEAALALVRPEQRLSPSRAAELRLLSRSPQNHAERTKDEVEVDVKAPVVDVFEIEPHPLVERDLVAIRTDLPEAGEPGANGETAILPLLVAQYLAGKRGPRADDA